MHDLLVTTCNDKRRIIKKVRARSQTGTLHVMWKGNATCSFTVATQSLHGCSLHGFGLPFSPDEPQTTAPSSAATVLSAWQKSCLVQDFRLATSITGGQPGRRTGACKAHSDSICMPQSVARLKEPVNELPHKVLDVVVTVLYTAGS